MIANVGGLYRWPALLTGVLAGCLLPCATVFAQEGDSGYRTSEARRSAAIAADGRDEPSRVTPVVEGQNTGPVRLARFALVSGNVSWRADASSDWSRATVNLPLRQGAQVWVTDGGRADVQFDDGSELRLGNGALATLKTLYSDKDGEFTQIALNEGLATLRSRHDNAVYQVDTPSASVKSSGSTQIRFGVDSGSEVTVQRGSATIEGPDGRTALHAGDYLYLADSNSPLQVRTAPKSDAWDQWNDDRNRVMENRNSGHVPSNIGLVAGELDSYGTWRTDPAYGSVWCPRNVSSSWRPYYDGRWTWIDPFGWTWVSSEPWGWAPYHYGTWVRASYGWGWCPGPVHQYWSPAVVHFSVYNDYVAWAPLCPSEVHYPSAFSFGYWGQSWAFSFSIGSAGVYYPSGGYCVGRPFSNVYVNNYYYGNARNGFRNNDGYYNEGSVRGGGSPSFDRYARGNEFAAANNRFVPFNGSRASGASFARTDTFGGRGQYQQVAAGNSSYFTRGRFAAAPATGQAPVAGPPSVAPTAIGRTPTRAFTPGVQPSASALNRPLYHAQTPINNLRGAQPGIGGGSGLRPGGLAPGSILGTRGRAPGDTPGVTQRNGRIGNPSYQPNTGDSRLPGLAGRQGVAGAPQGGRVYTPDTTRIQPGMGRVSAADAARQARETLNMGGRTPYGGAGSAADQRASPYTDRTGRSSAGGVNSGSGRAPYGGSSNAPIIGSGRQPYGSSNAPIIGSGRAPYGGTSNAPIIGSIPGSSSRQPDSGYRQTRPGYSGDGGNGTGGYRTEGGAYGQGSPYSRSGGDYQSGRSRNYGETYPGRSTPSGGYSGGYNGRSYGSDAYQGRTPPSGGSSGGRSGGSAPSGGYNGSRSSSPRPSSNGNTGDGSNGSGSNSGGDSGMGRGRR